MSKPRSGPSPKGVERRAARPWVLASAAVALLASGSTRLAARIAPGPGAAVAPAACASCHQGGNARRACETNVPMDERAPTRCVDVSMVFAGRPPVTRTLPFSHVRHQQFECFDCHATSVSRTVTKTCTSCHERHHQPDRDCLTCHDSPLATHTNAVHTQGCTAAGCHAAETTAVVTPIRPVCVVCHVAQQNHKEGRSCGTCHLVKWTSPGGGGGP